MKTKIALILLGIGLFISVIGNILLVLVVNDEVNAQKRIVRCIETWNGKTDYEVTVEDLSKHVGGCIMNNATIDFK